MDWTLNVGVLLVTAHDMKKFSKCVKLTRSYGQKINSNTSFHSHWSMCRNVEINSTLCPNENVHLLFLNISVRNQPIFTMFGAHIILWCTLLTVSDCSFAWLKF